MARRWTMAIGAALAVSVTSHAGAQTHTGVGSGAQAFEGLDNLLPTPNVYRAATGEPGPQYWQQRADYVIDVALDEEAKRITGAETILYTNNSPHTLRYLWVQLDQNRFAEGSTARMTETAATAGSRREAGSSSDRLSFSTLERQMALEAKPYGFQIEAVQDGRGRALPYTIVDTHMRIDLPQPLEPGNATEIDIDWSFNIIDESVIGGRGGYEGFPVEAAEKTDDYIYFLAQWFPRMTAFSDYEGWHNKAFLGRGEFTLEFGDYEVSITVPADHVVSASGVLQNPDEVLTETQRARLEEAREAEDPVFIVTPEEARENEAEGTSERKTWKFRAENVRDFAWSSSRKYIWDAMGYTQDDEEMPFVMAMSFYPNEAEPIWSQYSTEAVVHTMDVYSRFSFPYPYPTAQSVNTWARGGMEYPMVTFNGYRPNKDDAPNGEVTYSRSIKYGLIGVIIHEIGHIYFPMVVNSDERQWTWMDEGINTFLEFMAEYEWEEDFPIVRGKVNPLDYITDYMTSPNQVPIMTQSDSVLQFGPNAYTKPASALVVLRETVLGRELFDAAFKEYARRWKFKRPTPSDFFRTMEEVSGKDLDWFFRGWFFTTDHVDIAVTSVREYRISTQDPETEMPLAREKLSQDEPEPLTQIRNREAGMQTRLQRRDQLSDFYTENDQFVVDNKDLNDYQRFLDGLNPRERATFDQALEDDPYVYFIDFENVGGVVMPIPMTLSYADGSTAEMQIPAEIWRQDAEGVTKLIISEKEITSVAIDEAHEIADADRSNNQFPPQIAKSRFELYKSSRSANNQMADQLVELEGGSKTGEPTADDAAVPLTPSDAGETANAADAETPAQDESSPEAAETSEGESGND